MKAFFANSGKIVAVLAMAIQLSNSFCSRRLQPDSSSRAIEENTGNQKILVEPEEESKEFKNIAIINKDLNKPSENPFSGIKADRLRLETFMKEGIEKKIDTGGTSAEKIIETAREYLGVPHCMGGTTMQCMDCSGLLVRVFSRHSISLPHSSEDQARYGRIIVSKNELVKGDLVFFTRSYKTSNFITHSGIYAGDNKFIHTSSNKGVTITSLDDSWWREKFVFGTRLFD